MMKRFSQLMFIAIALMLSAGGCGGGGSSSADPSASSAPIHSDSPSSSPSPAPSDSPSPAAKSIVLYFSYTGNTERAANIIAARIGAAAEKFTPVSPYPSDRGECTEAARDEKNENARPPLNPLEADISEYDTIYLGYPIWHGDMPMIIYTFLEENDLSGKMIYPFCTHGGSGLSGTVGTIRSKCQGADVKDGLAMRGTDDMNAAIGAWLPVSAPEASSAPKPALSRFKISAGGNELTASFSDTAAARELADELSKGNITVSMRDYGNMEKVGSLPHSFSADDVSITTVPGDVMLYHGNQIVIFYGSNSWSYTPLGKIDGTARESILSALGGGEVVVTLSAE